MTEEEAAHWSEKMRIAARLKGFKAESAEYTQNAILKWLEYEHTHKEKTSQTVNQAIIDEVRKELGRSPLRILTLKQMKGKLRAKELGWILKAKQDHIRDLISDDFFNYLLDNLEKEERIVVCLTFQYGLTNEELSQVMNFSANYVYQVIENAKNNLKRILRIEKRRTESGTKRGECY